MPEPESHTHSHALRIRDTYYASSATTTHDHPTAYPDSHTHAGTDTISYGVAEPVTRYHGDYFDPELGTVQGQRKRSAKVSEDSDTENVHVI